MSLIDLMQKRKIPVENKYTAAVPAVPAVFKPISVDIDLKTAKTAKTARVFENVIEVLNPCPVMAINKKIDLISAYCPSYHGHCSVKIGGNYPDQCAATNCEYKDLPPVPGKWGVYTMADYCPERANLTTQHAICPCCNGSDFWQSAVQENHSVCRKCHPPAPGAEKGAE